MSFMHAASDPVQLRNLVVQPVAYTFERSNLCLTAAREATPVSQDSHCPLLGVLGWAF